MPTFLAFCLELGHNPALAVTALLTLGVMVVNGWTDAPNAIAGAVVTGALSFRRAVVLAACFEILGVLWAASAGLPVARTVYAIARFQGDPQRTSVALCAAMAAVVVWAAAAWRWGIPTSESHALMAGLTGAAAALGQGWQALDRESWGKVLLGLLLSTGAGVLAGWWTGRVSRRWPGEADTFRLLQIPGAAGTALLHGAQDGQKFMGVFLLGMALAQGGQGPEMAPAPRWLALVCAGAMALGCALGGRRIIDRIGRDMVRLTPRDGFAADLGGNACLLLSTLLGFPVSTTHTRTSALLGVGLAGGQGVDWKVAGGVALTWVLTFPGCGCLGYVFTRLWL